MLIQNWAFHQAANNTFAAFQDRGWGHLCREYTWVGPASSPKPIVILWEQGGHAKGWVVFLLRSIVGCDLNSKWSISLCPNWEERKPTPSISHASTTHSQSLVDNMNADQGMCFSTWLLWHNVVIGPYISSADVKNTPTSGKGGWP